MKVSFKSLVLGAALALTAGAVASAADMSDPVVGTWNLNVAKSKYPAGEAPKSQTRTYKQTDDGIAMTAEGVNADGSNMHMESTFKYDGKDYAITGTDKYDMIAVTKLNSHQVKSVQKKDGKTVGSLTRTVSKDGKTLTLQGKEMNAKGAAHYTAVLDKAS